MNDKDRDEAVVAIREDTGEILKILNGNGQVGIVAKVQILWRSTIWTIGGILLVLGGLMARKYFF